MAFHFTEKQEKILNARDRNLLVSAAAGSGKTAVLVERILRLITDPERPRSIDRLLVVTFTKAAAAQMKERIAQGLAERLKEDPDNAALQRQEMLLPNAQITTIDSFCAFLLRNHFSEIDLDPAYTQMEETEAQILLRDTAGDFLESRYQEADPAFLACVDYFCAGMRDDALEDLLITLIGKISSTPFPEDFLREHESDYDVPAESAVWELPWAKPLLSMIRTRILDLAVLYDRMIALSSSGDGPAAYTALLTAERQGFLDCGEDAESIRQTLLRPFEDLPRVSGKKAEGVSEEKKKAVQSMRQEVKKVCKDIVGRYFSVDEEEEKRKMQEASGPFKTLLELTAGLYRAYAEEKKARGQIDFGDLEHFALRILTDRDENGRIVPSRTACTLRSYYEEIMIDEYQDSNEVQELLLSMISGEAEGRYDRFMVGDMKQSIYKFRMARPEIFMEKFDLYRPDGPVNERVDLDRNFRSRPEVLTFVNRVFRKIMRPEAGGILYDDVAELKAGAEFPFPDGAEPDLYLPEILWTAGGEDTDETKRMQEARTIAARIRRIVGTLPVYDKDKKILRPARYGDIVILLRTGKGWFEEFRQVLEEEGIPVHVTAQTGYFSAAEIRTVLELFKVLDNPRQDIPLYAVLHGYFGGFSEEELSGIRASYPEGSLYDAIEYAASPDADLPEIGKRAEEFLEKLKRWRTLAAEYTVYDLLVYILDESGFENYSAAMPAGAQRTANLKMLLSQAESFNNMRENSLYHFLRYIDRMNTYEIDYGEASLSDEQADVVRMMSIHKSKGLEFPIVFAAGLSKKVNRSDAAGALIFDHDLGFGLEYRDPVKRLKSPTLRKEAVAQKIITDLMGEELRVLYVAMTRAEEKLYLSGYLDPGNDGNEAGKETLFMGADGRLSVSSLLKTPTGSSILAVLLQDSDVSEVCRTSVRTVQEAEADRSLEQDELYGRKKRIRGILDGTDRILPSPEYRDFGKRLQFIYPHAALSGLYTKTSVSELKHAAMAELFPETENEEDESIRLFAETADEPVPRFVSEETKKTLKGAARGSAFHQWMEALDYARFADAQPVSRGSVEEWMEELTDGGRMPAEYADQDLASDIAAFLNSPIGSRMSGAFKAGVLYREQPFVLGISADRLDSAFPPEETILVQGIIDAFFEEGEGLVLLDYKTDKVTGEKTLIDRYRVQLDLYEEALTRILRKPVREKLIYSTALRKLIAI